MIFRSFKVLLFIISLQLSSCSNELKVKSFYLKTPLIEKETLTFISKNKKNIQLWEISKNKATDFIKTRRLNSKNEFIDEIIEKVTQTGSELISYKFIEKTGEFPFIIDLYPQEKNLIKWNLQEPSIYTGEYINNGIIFKVERKREFLKKENKTLIFKDFFESKPIKGQLNHIMNKSYLITFSQTSYFEKNKGLVKYERIYSNGKNEVFELQEQNNE